MYILIKLEVSEPQPIEGEPGLFQTLLTHASLAGSLVLAHGQDRRPLLGAIAVDPKQIDPVRALFEELRGLSDS